MADDSSMRLTAENLRLIAQQSYLTLIMVAIVLLAFGFVFHDLIATDLLLAAGAITGINLVRVELAHKYLNLPLDNQKTEKILASLA